METKGRPKVASLQGSANTCMQWAVVGPPGDERRRTGEEIEMGGGMMGQMDAVRSLAQYPKRAHSLADCVFVDSVSVS